MGQQPNIDFSTFLVWGDLPDTKPAPEQHGTLVLSLPFVLTLVLWVLDVCRDPPVWVTTGHAAPQGSHQETLRVCSAALRTSVFLDSGVRAPSAPLSVSSHQFTALGSLSCFLRKQNQTAHNYSNKSSLNQQIASFSC